MAKYELKDRSYFGWQAIEKYGDRQLSIVAGPMAYCEPRARLPSIECYNLVEIAIFDNSAMNPNCLPPELLEEFGGDVVAGYVTWDYINKVRRFLEANQSHAAYDTLAQAR